MRYRALIVDDEPIIRYGLASTVDWSGAGIELAGEAGNGEAALALVGEREIDVLITDIKMPRMDGLELIRLSRQRRPHLKAILISSYSDFEYAREAVRLEAVVDYLLKPTMEPEDVTRLLGVCRAKLDEERALAERSASFDREERSRTRHGFETELHRCLAGQPADLAALERELPGPYRLSVWRAEEGSLAASGIERQAELLTALLPDGIVCASGERELSLLLAERPGDGVSVVRRVREAFAALCGMVDVRDAEGDGSGAGKAGATGSRAVFTAGTGPPFHRLDRVRDAYGWARNALEDAFFQGAGHCYEGTLTGKPGADAAAGEARDRTAALRETLSRRLADADDAACERTLQQLFDLWLTRKLPPAEIRKAACDVLLRLQSASPHLRAEERLEQFMGDYERLLRAGSLAEVIAEVQERFRQGRELQDALPLAPPMEDSGSARAIQTAVTYIREHFRSEITLREVADSVHMSRNYFSEQFKRRTGLNFIDYVIRLRVNYARHLLEGTTLKVHDIGTQCGFNSAKHFLKMFKREAGCTPAEYRSRAQQGGEGA
ncbi:helix-turn-helix domain-containing protein [Cohnella sp. JJ-181]|uniref:helix-turn-helix domain-containing protein n=1 Tax=Cohnella rhizoplanae TaxID=2974897 RepID=UPI0022FF937C|nr:helix-turn-helix domain-containing protein [Cohnella sp. JJ-181]CAI6042687.1 HTH-type transcriptional activator RhaR [Cohnella sp. JJ-181]